MDKLEDSCKAWNLAEASTAAARCPAVYSALRSAWLQFSLAGTAWDLSHAFAPSLPTFLKANSVHITRPLQLSSEM